MNDNKLLYNSHITKFYIEYISRYYPAINIEELLNKTEITRYEIEDSTQWFSQEQVDRFYEIARRETKNPDLAREAGRFSVVSSAMGTVKRYTLGIMNPASVYLLMGKTASMFTRGAQFETSKLGRDLIEVTVTPEPGVKEKPYQCQNRQGALEALSLLFSEQTAEVEQPECIHSGGSLCRYWIRVPRLRSIPWKRARNISMVASIIGVLMAAILLPPFWCVPLTLGLILVMAFLTVQVERLEKKELMRALRSQGSAARGQIDEMKIRADNALLVQELGQVTSSIVEEKELILTVLGVMKKRLDFDRGILLLAGEDEKTLSFAGAYGYQNHEEKEIRTLQLRLDGEGVAPTFLEMFSKRTPLLLNNPSRIEKLLPEALDSILLKMRVNDCICAPMLYENRIMGLLLVHHDAPKRPLTGSDLSLLGGVASHTAVSIANSRGFRRLEESERNYRELVQAANSVIVRMDNKGTINFVNKFALNLFGFENHEILGRNAVGTVLPDTGKARQGLENLMQRLREEPLSRIVNETRNLRRNGEELWIAWTFRPFFSEDGELTELLCIGNDITELRLTREEKTELTKRLQRARRMEAIGSLAGGVAHELNNILSGIVSYPELLLMDLPPDSTWRRPVETIQKAGEKAAGIVQDMLLLSRKGVSAQEVLNVNRLLGIYLDGAEHRALVDAYPGVTLDLSLNENVPHINGSTDQIMRVIQCLVTNAFEAMPEGGVLQIKTDFQSLENDKKGYEKIAKGEYTLLSVTDQGRVLSEEDMERIFEPFYTKKVLKRLGTGLGMPVVWGIVKDHEGFVDVQSKEGEGTAFVLYLPVASQRQEQFEPSHGEATDLEGHGEVIVVVDDVEEQRTIAGNILERLGYQVVPLGSGEAAVEFMRENSADLIVLDMVMEPGIDGLETYSRILAIRPGQKAIIASGYSETERVKEARRLGAGAYLKKPYNVVNLGRAVRSELNRQGGSKRRPHQS